MKEAVFKGEEALRGYARREVQKIHVSAMRAASFKGEFALWAIPPWM